MIAPGRRRIALFVGCVAALIVASLVMQARVERRYRTSAAQHVGLAVDSIDYRPELTRLYGRLLGLPHTSQRIDALTLTADGRTYVATDIDGVDMGRWFQWEEEGAIAVEIDFGAMPPIAHGVVTITTPRGVDTLQLDRP